MHRDKANNRNWSSAPARCFILVFALALLAAQPAHATPNTWPFDFDPQLADDPAVIQDGLDELGQGLPGLPDEEMTEVELGTVKLYLFHQLASALDRAVDAGPGLMPTLARPPVMCAAHEAFVYPSMDVLPLPSCYQANQSIAASLSASAKTCTEVEYPETYVLDHPPGEVDVDTVSSFEGLIAVAGEAFSHLDYPNGLLPAEFFTKLRPIIAKIRYTTLNQEISEGLASYNSALMELSSSSSCFDASQRSSLESSIADLTGELNQAQQELDELYQSGLTQAAAERAAAQAQCRAREDLLHPALTDEERVLLSFYIGGIYWRARGAGLLAYPPDPGQGFLRRVLYVRYPFQLIGDLTGGGGADAIGDSILFDENWGWDDWWDMGTTPGSADKYFDLVGMTKRGKRSVDLAWPQIEDRGYDISSLVAGAMQMGPCYYYSWDQLPGFRLGNQLQDPYMWFIEWPTSIGEFCAGATLAEGLARTLLQGTPIPEEECVASECPDGDCGDGGPPGGNDSCGTCPDGKQCSSNGECVPLGGDAGVNPPAESNAGCGCTHGQGAGGSGPWGFAFLTILLLVRKSRR